MGITPTSFEVISRFCGKDLSVITIGRQRIYDHFLNYSVRVTEFGYFDQHEVAVKNGWKVNHLDISDRDGAYIAHDLNLPLDKDKSAEFSGKFDFLIDSGTLEHLFNIPVALKSYADFVKVGGHIYICTCANNHFGHGLYQFSSDFFYRYFTQQNGFEIVDCFLERHSGVRAEMFSDRKFFDAPDPASVGGRTLLFSSHPILIHVVARKVEARPAPVSVIQSGYEADSASPAPKARRRSSLKSFGASLREKLPLLSLPYDLWKTRWRLFLGRNRMFPSRAVAAPGARQK